MYTLSDEQVEQLRILIAHKGKLVVVGGHDDGEGNCWITVAYPGGGLLLRGDACRMFQQLIPSSDTSWE